MILYEFQTRRLIVRDSTQHCDRRKQVLSPNEIRRRIDPIYVLQDQELLMYILVQPTLSLALFISMSTRNTEQTKMEPTNSITPQHLHRKRLEARASLHCVPSAVHTSHRTAPGYDSIRNTGAKLISAAQNMPDRCCRKCGSCCAHQARSYHQHSILDHWPTATPDSSMAAQTCS